MATVSPNAREGAARERPDEYDFEGLIGRSPPMRLLFDRITRVAPLAHHVSIWGETGTGKELVARAVHGLSTRRSGPFVDVNCAAVPPTLFEAEFFGHERGAFTGAQQARPGFFERAHGGTLFLDEIADMPPDCQAKLLRAVEQRSVLRVGARVPTSVDLRIVSATHVNLSESAALGVFRADLYHRLAANTLLIPAVRERGCDLDLLIDHFLERAKGEVGRLDLALSDDARLALRAHPWPGNVREIEHALRHATIEAAGAVIERGDLPSPIAGSGSAAGRRLADRASGGSRPRGFDGLEPLSMAVAQFELDRIERALRVANGHRARAAAALGISERTLYNKLRHHRLDVRHSTECEPRPSGSS